MPVILAAAEAAPVDPKAMAALGAGIAIGLGALGSSLAMILPISTPPNALAHATGLIKQSEMMKVGIIVGILGLIVGLVWVKLPFIFG